MSDLTRKTQKNGSASHGETRQNSYVEDVGSKDTDDAPDIQQPGTAGDFGNGSLRTPADKKSSTALPSKHSSGRTPGDQPELARLPDGNVADSPDDAAEASNPYSGT